MPNKSTKTNITLKPQDNDRLANLCGTLDENLRQIELFMDVEISNRGNSFFIKGDEKNVPKTSDLIKRLYSISEHELLTPKQLHIYLNDNDKNMEDCDEDSTDEY